MVEAFGIRVGSSSLPGFFIGGEGSLSVRKGEGDLMAPAVILAVVAIAGAATKVGSNIIEANAEQTKSQAVDEAYQHNADVKDAQAAQVDEQTAFNVMKMNVINRRDIGQQVATYGVAGVDKSGSALDVLAESTKMAHMDALNLAQKGSYQSTALRADAAFGRQTGNQIAEAGKVSPGKILLGGASAASSAFPAIYRGVSGGGGSGDSSSDSGDI